MKKRILSFLLSLTVFSGVIPFGLNMSAMATTSIAIEPIMERGVYYSIESKLGTFESFAFELFTLSGMLECQKEIDVRNYNITVGEAREIIFAMKDSYPELYHLSGFNLYGVDDDGNGDLDDYEKAYIVEPVYYYSKAVYDEYSSAYKQAAAEMLSDINENSDLTIEQILILLHDRIAVNCEYDYENYAVFEQKKAENPKTQTDDFIPAESFSMYGALVEGVAVCEGYAKAYQYLLNELGIENELCPSKELNHVWNIVEVNGEKYHVDITWDDITCTPIGHGGIKTDTTGNVNHNNFLRSNQGIASEGHNSEFVGGQYQTDYKTASNSTYYDNYFWQDSNTAFNLLDGEVYYINNSTAQLNKWAGGNGSDDALVQSVDAEWDYDVSNYAKLSGDGENLYYNSDTKIYEYNPLTGTSEIKTPELGENEIYGFKASHGWFYIDTFNSPYYNLSEKQANAKNWLYNQELIDITDAAEFALADIVEDAVYTGSPITFNIPIVAGGKKLNIGYDYVVTYDKNVNIGTATVTVTGIGAYKGTAQKTFEISSVDISQATVSGISDKVYTGKPIIPNIYVTCGGKALVLNKDYYIMAENNLNTGMAKIKIIGIGGYTGSITKYFYIHPSAVAVVKVSKATSSSITIKWRAVKSGTGYAVLRATSKNGNYKTIGYVESIKKTSYTAKKLSKNKTYYFKIIAYKTVNNKKYTSPVSPILKAKTGTSTPKITYYKNSSTKAVKLKWSKVSGAKGYQVYMRTGKKGSYKKIYSGSKQSYTKKKLKKGKTYYFKVRTYKVSSSGVNAYSSYSSVKKVKINK